MEENRSGGRFGDAPEIKSEAFDKLSNFWYYYKWHTIVALFIVFVVTVCTLQTCSKGGVENTQPP